MSNTVENEISGRPLEAIVDLRKIKENLESLKALIPRNCSIMAVVKANGYGHGAVEVSRAALDAGASCLGVALLEEAIELRDSGFTCPIHLLFEPSASSVRTVVRQGLKPTVYTESFARSLSECSLEEGRISKVHLKVDTGMRRVGIDICDVEDFAELLSRLKGIDVEGICTHFAVATDPKNPFTQVQIERFKEAASTAEKIIGKKLVKHAANSAGVIAFHESHFDMVRIGIAMYGLYPSHEFARYVKLKPALSLRGNVVYSKRIKAGEGVSYGLEWSPETESWVATIPVGYADGFSRLLSGKGQVLIRGKRRDVVGVVCMDMCMVNLGEEKVEEGENFVIIGKDGDEEITVDEIAEMLGTINYEVTCMISSRVPRRYIY